MSDMGTQVHTTSSGKKFMSIELKKKATPKKSVVRSGIATAKAVFPAVSVLLSAYLVFSKRKHDDVGVVFYLNCLCLIIYHCLEVYSSASNIEQCWRNPHVHAAIVTVAFCLGKVTLVLYWTCTFVLMIKAVLKVVKMELGSQYREIGNFVDTVNQNVWIKRIVAVLEVLIVPWLLIAALVNMNGPWFSAWIVYFVVFIMYQLVFDDQHRWLYGLIGRQLRDIANANRNGFGPQLHKALNTVQKLETVSCKLYPKTYRI